MSEEKSDKPEGSSAQENKFAKAFATVSSYKNCDVPQAASAALCWESKGQKIDYDACASHVDVFDDTGKLTVKMFAVSYVQKFSDSTVLNERPVTFCFNGGPGSASVPINLGGFGPMRVQTKGTEHLSSAAVLADNPYTLLTESDLVFLDAPGTGFSSLAQDVCPNEVFGIDGDADAFCRAICEWLQQNNRWQSPLYLLGESYGTVRNAVLMRLLGERGVKLTGVIMVSAIWDWAQVLPGSDLYYLGMFPTYAACAQYFGRAGKNKDVDEFFSEALTYSDEVLAPAYIKGDRLDAQKEYAIAQVMESFIGIPADFIARRHLRISLDEFRKRLLRDDNKVVGRLDMRFVSDAPGYAQQDANWFANEDAADDAVSSVWTSRFRSFLADKLGYKCPGRYLDNNYQRIGERWSFDHETPGTSEKVGAPNLTIDLACALRRDPTVKLCIIAGRYDSATPFWNVIHDLSAQYLSAEIKQKIEIHCYGCGHMPYVDEPSLQELSKDLRAFYAKS